MVVISTFIMLERNYKSSAETFLNLQIENLILPLDDQDIPPDMVQSRYNRIIRNQNNDFVVDMKRELGSALISGYFINQIIFDAIETQALGILSVDEVVERAACEYYIDINSGEYGIFDPDFAHQAEYDFLNYNWERLQDLEQTCSRFSPRLREWENYLYPSVFTADGEEALGSQS